MQPDPVSPSSVRDLLTEIESFIHHPDHDRAWVERDRRVHALRIGLGPSFGDDPWMCTVCGRAPAPADTHEATWYACTTCMAIDKRAASALGFRMLLPLYDITTFGTEGTVLALPGRTRTDGLRQIATLLRKPEPLLRWRNHILDEAATELGLAGRRDISAADWMVRNEWSPDTCAGDYVQVLAQLAPLVFDDDERLLDAEWLAEGAQ